MKTKTLADWKADPKLRTELKGLLDSPALSAAVETLKQNMAPTVPTGLLNANAISLDEVYGLAYRQAHTAGFFGFAAALRNLAEIDAAVVPLTLEPWAHIAAQAPKTKPLSKKISAAKQ